MKKYLLFSFMIAFSAVLSAQTMPSVNSVDASANIEEVSKKGTDMEAQIKSALIKDEGLQKETIKYLKNNPDTKNAVVSMAKKNSGSKDGLIKSIIGDKTLSQAAIDYISNNPELLSKAMKVIGM